MTDIEQKALALVNEIERQEGLSDLTPRIMRGLVMDEALCRAIEQHEAFRREVSEAVEQAILACGHDGMRAAYIRLHFARFIIPQPDPLVEVMQEWWDADGYASIETFRATLAARGLKIVKKEPSQ